MHSVLTIDSSRIYLERSSYLIYTCTCNIYLVRSRYLIYTCTRNIYLVRSRHLIYRSSCNINLIRSSAIMIALSHSACSFIKILHSSSPHTTSCDNSSSQHRLFFYPSNCCSASPPSGGETKGSHQYLLRRQPGTEVGQQVPPAPSVRQVQLERSEQMPGLVMTAKVE